MYYPINEEAARRANDANSHSDYVRGSATASYKAQVDEVYTIAEETKKTVVLTLRSKNPNSSSQA